MLYAIEKWWDRLFGQPSGVEVLRRQLEDAERARAEHIAAAEYHSAMRTMLDARISRLKREVQ